MYTIATQAITHKFFDAAVVFFNILKKQVALDQRKGNEKLAKVSNFKITYENARHLHQKAVQIHDEVLLHKGQYGMLHVCRDQPYHATRKNAPRSDNVDYILDRDRLYQFKAKERIKRTRLGRKKWIGEYKIAQNESQALQKATMLQINKLCNGKQIKASVNISRK